MDPIIFFKACGDKNRLHCLRLILHFNRLCVCDLVNALKLEQPTVSRHLAYLRNKHILQDERHGKWVFYRLHPQLAHWAKQTLKNVQQADSASFQQLIDEIESKGGVTQC